MVTYHYPLRSLLQSHVTWTPGINAILVRFIEPESMRVQYVLLPTTGSVPFVLTLRRIDQNKSWKFHPKGCRAAAAAAALRVNR